MSKTRRWLPGVTVVTTYLLLLGGTLVTKTGSGDACGETWPSCNGSWFPPLNDLNAWIEYSHRIVTGIGGFLILAFIVQMWRRSNERKSLRYFALAALFFLFIQSWLGALAARQEQPTAVLAAHFGISLAAFTSVLLPAIVMTQLNRPTPRLRAPVSRSLRMWTWIGAIFTFGLVYSGAYVRHTDAMGGCLDWPLCQGAIIPPLEGITGIHFTHRLLSFVGLILIGWLWWKAREVRNSRPDISRGATVAFGMMLAQVLSGGVSVLTEFTLFSMMLHSALVIVLFGALAYLCMQVSSAAPGLHPLGRHSLAGSRL